MSLALFICIGIAGAALGAYTRAFQRATLYWGTRLSSDDTGRGLQDALTPSAQNFRNIASFAIHIVLLVS